MTKEDILEAAALDVFSLEQILDEFFDSNVCIPRGATLQRFGECTQEWYDIDKYRIKPSEPTYEWQWVCQEHKDTEFFVPAGWHTFEELQPSMYSLSRLEETKRVRV